MNDRQLLAMAGQSAHGSSRLLGREDFQLCKVGQEAWPAWLPA